MQDILHAFPGQEPTEPVYVFAHPDPIAFIPTALLFLLVIGFSFLFEYGFIIGVPISFTPYLTNLSIAVMGGFQLLAITVFFTALLDFYADLLIVTGKRLVLITQNNLLNRDIAELALEEVEDVNSNVAGLLPNIFNYGTIQVQTAAATDQFRMDSLHLPREITALILNLSEQAKKGEVPEPDEAVLNGVIGVINSKPMHSTAELRQAGALPDESGAAQ